MADNALVVTKMTSYRIEKKTFLSVPEYLIDHLVYNAPDEVYGRWGGVAGAVEVTAGGQVVGVLAFFPGSTLKGLKAA